MAAPGRLPAAAAVPAAAAATRPWIFTPEELERTPSIVDDGMTVEEERQERHRGCALIAALGQRILHGHRKPECVARGV